MNEELLDRLIEQAIEVGRGQELHDSICSSLRHDIDLLDELRQAALITADEHSVN